MSTTPYALHDFENALKIGISRKISWFRWWQGLAGKVDKKEPRV